MKKSVEMRKELDKLKNDIATLQASGKTGDAHAKLTELNQMRQAIDVQEALEKEEAENFIPTATPSGTGKLEDKAKVQNRVFNKQVFGLPLSDQEREYASVAVEPTNAAGSPGQVGATPAKGGFLLPEEQFTRLLEYRRGLVALKTYCEVVPVSRRSGSIPTTLDDSSELTNFDELNEIAQKDIDFGSIKFEAADYGEIIPVSNTLLEDINVDLVGVIGRRFARKAVRTENSKILALLKGLTPSSITDYKGIKTALNKKIDPALLEGSIILTNQSGFDYLDLIELENGQPLLQPVLTDLTKKRLAGYEVVVMSDASLPLVSGKIPFFVGNIYEFAKFFDRKQVTIDASTEAGFTKNATLLRAIERFDVQKADSDAVVYLQLSQTTAP